MLIGYLHNDNEAMRKCFDTHLDLLCPSVNCCCAALELAWMVVCDKTLE